MLLKDYNWEIFERELLDYDIAKMDPATTRAITVLGDQEIPSTPSLSAETPTLAEFSTGLFEALKVALQYETRFLLKFLQTKLHDIGLVISLIIFQKWIHSTEAVGNSRRMRFPAPGWFPSIFNYLATFHRL